MAKNQHYDIGRRFPLNVAAVNGSGAGDLVQSGDPGAVGQLPFVALTDEGTDGIATVDVGGVYRLPVSGINDVPANVAVAPGDRVYWDNGLGRLDVGPNGVPFGFALEAVAAGATTTIAVKVQPGA